MERELFNEILVNTDCDTPQSMQLKYYLLSENIGDENYDLKIYGAEIDKHFDGKSEKKIIRDLFFKKGEAIEFLKKISDASVTPMGLKYAVHEHICDYLNIHSYEE